MKINTNNFFLNQVLSSYYVQLKPLNGFNNSKTESNPIQYIPGSLELEHAQASTTWQVKAKPFQRENSVK